MDGIIELLEINFSSVLFSVFVILTGFKAIISILEWLAAKTGIEFKWMRRKREDHDLLIKTSQELSDLGRQRDIDVEQSINHDKAIREDLCNLSNNVQLISEKLDAMKEKNDEAEMLKSKDTLINYYKKYKDIGDWTKLEADAFWGLFKLYEDHGGNGYLHSIVEPVMRELKVTDL